MEADMSTPAAEDLLNRIRIERFRMPKRLRLIADSLLDDPVELSILTTNELSKRLDVSASALVRFAKVMGYPGYAPMQKVLLKGLARADGGYRDRVRGFPRPQDGRRGEIDFLLEAFVSANARSLGAALGEIDLRALERMVAALRDARLVAVAGRRRAYPLAFYLHYGLSQLGRDCALFDGAAGMDAIDAARLGPKDALVVITFAPYAPEVVALAVAAAGRGARVLAVTDGPESPVCASADEVLHVTEANLNDIRSISVTATVIQTMFVALGMEIDVKAERPG
jgi:DNA-binding MurR/RpiR family transcriptional regulator